MIIKNLMRFGYYIVEPYFMGWVIIIFKILELIPTPKRDEFTKDNLELWK